MAEISRRARVGMATLYRNFPGRRELLEALYTDEVNAVCKAAKTVDGETPGAILTAWLHRFFTFVTSKRHIASELLKHTDRSNPLFDDNPRPGDRRRPAAPRRRAARSRDPRRPRPRAGP